MKSQSSLLHKRIFFNNLTRCWPLSVITIIISFLVQTIPVYISANDRSLPESVIKENIVTDIMSSQIFLLAAGFAAAYLVFGYLFSERLCNQIHSFPVKRITLFFTSFISGLALILIPQIINWIIMLPAFIVIKGSGAVFAAEYLISIIAFSLIYFSSAVISAVIAGNLVSMAVVYGIFNFAGLLISAMGVLYSSIFEDRAGFVFKENAISKILYLFEAVFPVNLMTNGVLNYFDDYDNDYFNIGVRFTIYILYLIISCLLIHFSFIIYKKRNMESAGSGISFKPVKQIIIIFADIAAAILVTFLISEVLLQEDNGFIVSVSFVIIGFFTAAGVRMIIEKTVSINVFKEIARWAVIAVCINLIFCGYNAAAGKYMPKKDRISSIKIVNESLYDFSNNPLFTVTGTDDKDTISILYDIASASKKSEKLLAFNKPVTPDYSDFYDYNYAMQNIPDFRPKYSLAFTLDNGIVFYRYINVDKGEQNDKIVKIFKENAVNSIMLSLDIKDIENADYIEKIEIGSNTETTWMKSYPMKKEKIIELLRAYAEDFADFETKDFCDHYFSVYLKYNSGIEYDESIVMAPPYTTLNFNQNYKRTYAIIEDILSSNNESLSEIDKFYEAKKDENF